MAENLQNTNIYTPSETQLKLLEAYLSQEVRESIESLCNKAGVSRVTYYEWLKKPEFNKWFYGQIELNKHRFAPRILDNLFTQAQTTNDKGTIELALKVLDLYTPTQKNINENHNMDYKAFIETVKKKATELSNIKVTESGVITDTVDPR